MFTGIVQGMAEVIELKEQSGLRTFALRFPENVLEGIQIGASVALNGTCLTVTSVTDDVATFDVMQETLDLTNMGNVEKGDKVNFERSAKMGDEIGGHVMSGHVIGTGEIVNVQTPENNRVVTIKVHPDWMKYILNKGFIGVDGCSLTVVNPDKEKKTFEIHLIPETLRLTAFGHKSVGDTVNIELDSRTQTIVDTVEEVLNG